MAINNLILFIARQLTMNISQSNYDIIIIIKKLLKLPKCLMKEAVFYVKN
jgi:hypothetical protein